MPARKITLDLIVDCEDDDAAAFAKLSDAHIKRELAAALIDELEPIEDNCTSNVTFFIEDAS
jgi:hypothetical protein